MGLMVPVLHGSQTPFAFSPNPGRQTQAEWSAFAVRFSRKQKNSRIWPSPHRCAGGQGRHSWYVEASLLNKKPASHTHKDFLWLPLVKLYSLAPHAITLGSELYSSYGQKWLGGQILHVSFLNTRYIPCAQKHWSCANAPCVNVVRPVSTSEHCISNSFWQNAPTGQSRHSDELPTVVQVHIPQYTTCYMQVVMCAHC